MKNIKKYNYIGIFSLLLVTLFSCVADDELVQVDPNLNTEASFWKTDADFLKGTNAIYGSMHIDGTYMRSTPLLLDLKDDATRSNSPWPPMANVGRFNTSLADDAIYGWAYRDFYQGIYRANQVFEYIEGVEFEDAGLKNRILGQAHFLRGLYLFHLVNFFKNVPVPLDNSTLIHEQKTEEEGWKQIIIDMKAATDLLPISYSNVSGLDAGQIGRATKGAALAYLGKAYLFTKDFPNARDAFKKVIGLNYSLVSNYRDNFTDKNENNSESIFEVQFSREAGGVDLSFGSNPTSGWGQTSARAITYGPRDFGFTDVQPTFALYNDFLIEKTVNDEIDPRLDATMFYNKPGGVMLYGQDFATFYASNANDLNDLFCRKYQNSDGGQVNEYDWRSGINERIMRYADVLLMYAEALNETGTTSEAYTYIQEVRDRVNLPDLAVTKPNMTKEQMRDQIAHERFLEFALEGHRFDDIRRWGWLQDSAKLAWLKSRDAEFETYSNGREYFPIPQSEMDNNPLVNDQNDGY
ncbi:RagB/SusD family nutrient uptake outer membrane protein [Thalassobellus suaedae]|uniref:RagB/SusD family nutrient uptake outer membrane protein n=1 Tax=Thalassobellus suaedae TaxID=3074124 RepID=A0ABY9XZA6_9FLAO|nr:RagB/SusD family nutrient uptake outer membrane protein [Flavobacteriaceae bacterium HL-DH10]